MIRSCDTDQRIPCFDNNKDYYQVKHRLQAPTQARKLDISHWFLCGADGRVYGHVITKISWMDRLQNYFRYGNTFDTNLRGASVMLPNLFWMTGHEGDKSTSKPGQPVGLISERQLQR